MKSDKVRVETIGHLDGVSLIGIENLNVAMLAISEALVIKLGSRASIKDMVDDFAGRLAEEEGRMRIIDNFSSMGSLTDNSPVKKRPAGDTMPDPMSNKKTRAQKERERKIRNKNKQDSPMVVNIKKEPGIKKEPID